MTNPQARPGKPGFLRILSANCRKTGLLLLSAHQMNLVEELCDSIFLINHGREVLSGKLQEIKDSYKESIVELRLDPDEDGSFENDFVCIIRKNLVLGDATAAVQASMPCYRNLRRLTVKAITVENRRCMKFSLKLSVKGVKQVKWSNALKVFRWEFLKT